MQFNKHEKLLASANDHLCNLMALMVSHEQHNDIYYNINEATKQTTSQF